MPAICRVLVIEDDAAVGDIVATVLAGEGYEVRTAHSGRVALSLLSAWVPDLLVLDLYMPESFHGREEMGSSAELCSSAEMCSSAHPTRYSRVRPAAILGP